MVRRIARLLCLALILPAHETDYQSAVNRIRQEALENSKGMEHGWHLADVYGSPLINTHGFRI